MTNVLYKPSPPSGAAATEAKQCTVCGSERIRLTSVDATEKWGACSFTHCTDPLRDFRAEAASEPESRAPTYYCEQHGALCEGDKTRFGGKCKNRTVVPAAFPADFMLKPHDDRAYTSATAAAPSRCPTCGSENYQRSLRPVCLDEWHSKTPLFGPSWHAPAAPPAGESLHNFAQQMADYVMNMPGVASEIALEAFFAERLDAYAASQRASLERQVEQLRVRLNRIICYNCGVEYAHDGLPDAARAVAEHRAICPKHPQREIDQLAGKLETAERQLREAREEIERRIDHYTPYRPLTDSAEAQLVRNELGMLLASLGEGRK